MNAHAGLMVSIARSGVTRPRPTWMDDFDQVVDEVLYNWQQANPQGHNPIWLAELAEGCRAHPGQARAILALFAQQAAGHTGSERLRRAVHAVIKMATCPHAEGSYSGRAGLCDGEYNDDTIFTCPDCGYKGS